MEDCVQRGCKLETLVGDGRVLLKRSQSDYDLILIDAFNSDAVPVHLLTLEAVRLYAARLSEGGLIGFHITNRYVDLEPVLSKIAESLGLDAFVRADKRDGFIGKRSSKWMILKRKSVENEGPPPHLRDWRLSKTPSARRVWTDDYADLVSELRLRSSR